MDATQYVDHLKKIPILEDLPPRDLQELSRACITRSTEESDFFFFQGDVAEHVFILIEGSAKLCKITKDGQQANLRTILPLQIFGAVGAVNQGSVYPACAQALENCISIAIPSNIFHEVIERSPELSFALMRLMTGYIREMQDRFTDMVTAKIEERLGKILIRLAHQSGVKNEDGLHLELGFTHQDLAEMIGTTQYSISRILTGWERQGVIKIQRKKVIIPNLHNFIKCVQPN